jgi:hypothetical protein
MAYTVLKKQHIFTDFLVGKNNVSPYDLAFTVRILIIIIVFTFKPAQMTHVRAFPAIIALVLCFCDRRHRDFPVILVSACFPSKP